MKKTIFLGILTWLSFVIPAAYAHQDIAKEVGRDVAAVIGEFSKLDGVKGTIAVSEYNTQKSLLFGITKDTLVSLCQEDVCMIGKGIGVFEKLGRYEDIGISHKGAMVTIFFNQNNRAVGVDMHLHGVDIAFSPSDYVSPF